MNDVLRIAEPIPPVLDVGSRFVLHPPVTWGDAAENARQNAVRVITDVDGEFVWWAVVGKNGRPLAGGGVVTAETARKGFRAVGHDYPLGPLLPGPPHDARETSEP